jgi:hypothetical protein
MNKIQTISAVALFALTTGSLSAQTPPKRKPKITEPAARVTALAQVPNGKVQAEELEEEGGNLIYSYDIKVAGKSGIEEVTVNALTGKVVSHVHEGAKAEAAEARADAKAARAAAKK